MARIRSLHPGQWADEDFIDLSFPARLLALALRNIADDHGVFEWKPRQIKMACLPADACEVEPLLAELCAPMVNGKGISRGHIVTPFVHDRRIYGVIRNFLRYQRIKSPKYTFPFPNEFKAYAGLDSPISEITEAEVTLISEIAGLKAISISEIEEVKPISNSTNGGIKSADVGGRRKEVRGITPLPPKGGGDELFKSDFDQFWAIYPRKDAKRTAEKAYEKSVKRASPETIMAGAQRYAALRAGQDPTYTALPATWLNGDRWADTATPPPAPSINQSSGYRPPPQSPYGIDRTTPFATYGRFDIPEMPDLVLTEQDRILKSHFKEDFSATLGYKVVGIWRYGYGGEPPGHPECKVDPVMLSRFGYLPPDLLDQFWAKHPGLL